MEEENPSKENNQPPSSYVDINRYEELVRETLRKEREDIIREKMKSYFFKTSAQRTLERQDEELKSASNKLIELDAETEQLRQVSENEMRNKVIIENDLENMKKITITCEEQLRVFKKTLEDIEVKSINTNESKANMSQQIQSFLENQKIRKEALEKEIRVMEAVIEAQRNNYSKTLEEKTSELDKLNEECTKLEEDDAKLLKIIEEKENINMLQQNKLEDARLQKRTVESEVEKLYEKISGNKKEFEEENLIQEEEIKAFEFKISLLSEKEEKQQELFEELREKHKQLDEQITKTEAEIEALDGKETELRNLVTDKHIILEEKTTKISSLREENNLKKEQCKKTQIELKENLEQMEKQNDDILERVENEKNKIQTLTTALKDAEQKKELEEKRLLDLRQMLEEDSLKHKNLVKEYEQKIKEVQLRRTEKANDYKRLSENLQKRMAEDKEKFQAVINEKTTILEKHKLTLNNAKEELESEEKKLQTLNSNIEKVKEIVDRGPKLSKKKCDEIKKLEKQIKNYEDEMSIFIKMENENHKKEMKLLEESVKGNLNKINDLKNLKDNLEEQLGQMMNEIVDVAQKLEMNKEQEIQTFKSPILPKRSNPIFISSTPKGVLKKPVENNPQIEETAEISASDGEDEFKKIFPLTQKTIEQKSHSQKCKTPMKVNLWPTDNETTDDSSVNKNISATQKPLEVTGLLGKPKISSTQSKKLPSLWLTDTEESEDIRMKNIPLTQKSEKKGFEQDADLFEEETYKKVELEKFDSYQSKKKTPTLTQKSDKKSGLTQKSSVYIKEENDPFESLKTSTQIAAKQTEQEKFDPGKPRKRMALDFFATDNDESDDSFIQKLNKSKKIQEKLKPAPKEESVIDLLDSSSTD